MGNAYGGRRFHTIDTIAGFEAARSYRQVIAEFDSKVVIFLENLDESRLAGMTDKELQQASRKLDDVASNIAAAHGFLRAAERFCSPTNVSKLWHLRMTMPKRDVTSRTERVLRRTTGVPSPDDDLAA
jgi:hypothetical protein